METHFIRFSVPRMVRFARVKGSHSKSSFNKVAEEASSWDELKTIPSGNHVSDSNEDLAFVSREQSDVICKPPVWSTIEPEALSKKKRNDVGGGGQAYSGGRGETICRTKNHHETKATKRSRQEKEEEGVDYKRRKAEPVESILSIGGEEIKLGKFDGYVVKEEDAVRLEELRQKLKKQGEDEKKIYALVKMERRKAERSVKQKKKSLCFHCRKGGHNLSECPKLEVKGSPSGPVSGICFKCGSTEHKLPQCKSKLMTLEFATCFICGQSGHLSKNCTNNPRGLYPDGGGCKHCKDVTHYERNCPILASKKKKRQEFVSARTIDGNNIEALDYEEEVWPRTKPVHSKTHKQPKRIIKF